MPCTVAVKKRMVEPEMCCNTATWNNGAGQPKYSTKIDSQTTTELYCPILPGLPDNVAKLCLALVPRSYIPVMGAVSKRWRSFIQCKEFITVRKEAGKAEEWIYVFTTDAEWKGDHWEILDPSGGEEHQMLPSMPGPVKAAFGFGVVVLHGKLLVMGGYSVDVGKVCASADVYQYDTLLNSWTKLADMNVTRVCFGCAEVNGVVYVVGGFGANGESRSSAEVYNPEKNEWTLIESHRRPRWGCFACSLEGKLFVMGGRSSIGFSNFVDVYSPEHHSWLEMKNECVIVSTGHAVIGRRLFCQECKNPNQRKLAVFDPTDNSWHKVELPLTGSSSIGFCFGILDGKLLLFSVKKDLGYRTLVYDPEAERGSEWKTTSLKPSGSCLCSVTIKA